MDNLTKFYNTFGGKMSSNMDEDDKTFFLKYLDDFKANLKKIEQHQLKTCKELHDVSKEVITTRTLVNNHLASIKEQQATKTENKINRREWILVGIASIASIIAIFGIFL